MAAVPDVVGGEGAEDGVFHLLGGVLVFEVEGVGGIKEALEVTLELEDFVAVDSDALVEEGGVLGVRKGEGVSSSDVVLELVLGLTFPDAIAALDGGVVGDH